MRCLFIFLLFCSCSLAATAQGSPRIKSELKGTNTSIWIPRTTIALVRALLPKEHQELKNLFPNLKSLRVKIVNGDHYRSRFGRKYQRQISRFDKPHFRPIVNRDGKKRSTRLVIKETRKGKKKKIIYLSNKENAYSQIKIRGNISLLPILKFILKKESGAELILDLIGAEEKIKKVFEK